MTIGKCDICKYGQTDFCTSPNRASNHCCETYLGTTEIEKRIRADERAKIKDEFKIYDRLEAKFTMSQCSEKDGLYCLDVTELFYGLVDRVLGETNNKEQK